MIVVDSSVWIAHLRGEASPATRMLHAIIADHDDQILIGDLTLFEVLQGARDEAHAVQIERALRLFPVVSMLDVGLAIEAARNYRLLRERGITIRTTIDMIIGTFCLSFGHALLHNDRDFEPMVAQIGLRIVAS